MTRVVANNAPFQLLITPRDAAGQPITNLGNIAKERWVVTDGTYNFTVNSSDTQFNTPYVQYLLSITPNVLSLGNKNLTIKLDNATVATAPSPLQYDFRTGYRGKFTLSNAVLAWDGSLPSDPTYELYDYSSNGRSGVAFNSSAFSRSIFTDTSQYKVGPSGTLTTLGRHSFALQFTASTATDGVEVVGDDLAALAVGNSFTAPPVKTIQACFWTRDGNVAGLQDCRLITYGIQNGLTQSGLAIWMDTDTNVISVKTNTGVTLISYPMGAPNNVFRTANEIVVLALRFNGDSTITFFVNKTNVGSATWTPVDEAGCAPFLSGPTNRLSAQWGSSASVTSIAYAMLDCAMYSDVKSDSFIQSNAAAWGF